MTVAEMASMGGRARAAKHSTEQLREFAKNAGRPAKLDPEGARSAEKAAGNRHDSG